MRMNDDRLVKVVMLEALEIESKVRYIGERFAAEFREAGVDRSECGGIRWIDS